MNNKNKMNKIVYILLVLFIYNTNGIAQNKKSIDLNWQTDFAKAKKLASSENKGILIYFTGHDRTDSCQMLNEDFFYTEKFQNIAKNHLILVRVNSDLRNSAVSNDQKKKNTALSKQFYQSVHPTVVLTDANGKLIGKIESYNYLRDTSKHYALLDRAIEK